MSKGFITLYVDGEFITSLSFSSVEQRKSLMNRLNETYQTSRQKKVVYYQLTAK